MNDRLGTRALINREDLELTCAVVGARFNEPEMEAERVELARRFLRAGLDLEQAMRAHTRCAVVNHSGTLGANNLVDATERMFEALASYAARVRDMSARFRDISWPLESELQAHGDRMAGPVALDG